MKEALNSSKHILILVDAFTRYTNLFPVKSTNSKETIKNLSYIFNDRGNPSILVSDRGTAFTSSEFQEFMASRNVKHRLVAVAAPWANGLVERTNRFLKSSLKKIVEDQLLWNTHIVSIQYIINNTYHKALKSTASMLLFGYDQRNHTDSQLIQYLQKIAKVDLDLDKEREEARKVALDVTNNIKEYNKLYYDEKHVRIL